MPRPTEGQILNAMSHPVVEPATAVMRVINEAWDADEAERERGQSAMDTLLLYGAPKHKPYCAAGELACTCGLSDAMEAIRDDGQKAEPPPGPAPPLGGLTASEAFALASPEAQVHDGSMWEYADGGTMEQYNREQRIRREACVEALASLDYCGERERQEHAAARYPLKKRVPAKKDDPHGACVWRLRREETETFEDSFEVSFQGGATGSWLPGTESRSTLLTWTARRVRVLAALLDSPWTFEPAAATPPRKGLVNLQGYCGGRSVRAACGPRVHAARPRVPCGEVRSLRRARFAMTLSGIPRERLLAALAHPSNAHASEALRRAAGLQPHGRAPERADVSQRGSSAAQEPVSLVLPLPPSVNSYWRSVPATKSRIARVLISEQGRRFKRACHLAAAAQCRRPMEGDVSIRCVVYFKDRRRDLDNVLKPLCDALNGVVYRDDRQVAHLEFTKAYDPKRPRLEMVVAPFVA